MKSWTAVPCLVAVCLLALFSSSNVRPSGGPGTLEAIRGLLASSDLAGAEAGARDELARLDKAGQAESLESADAADLLVEVLTAAGKSRSPEVAELAERALGIREAALGPDDLRVARSQTALARILSQRRVTPAAIALYEKSLATHEKVLGPDDPEVGKLVLDLGIALKNKGDRLESKPYMARAVAIFEKAYGPEHPLVAKAHNGLANALKHTGEYDKAIASALRAVQIMEKIAGPDSKDVGIYAVNLATLYRLVGQYSKARPIYDRAVRIVEKQEGADSPGYANTINSLANLYFEMGDLTAARPLYEKALGIWEKANGPDDAESAMAIRNLGGLFLRMGDLERARAYNERALSIWEKTQGPDHPAVANALMGLSAVWRAMGEPSRTIPLLQRAQRIQEVSRGPTHPSVATAMAALGSAQVEMGLAAEALPTLEKALASLEASVGPDHYWTAPASYDLGRALYRLGNYPAAKRHLERALSVAEKTYGPRHFELASTLLELGRLHWKTGFDQDAWAASIRAESIARRHFRLAEAGLSEREALQFESARGRGLDLAVSILVSGKGGDRSAGAASSRSGQAFDAVIRGRSMVLDALARRHRANIYASSPETAALLEALKDNKQRLARLAMQGPDDASPETYLASFEEAQEAKERSERELALKTASLPGRPDDQDLGLSDVLGLVPRNAAVVSYIRYHQIDPASSSDGTPAYVAFLLKPGSAEPLVIPLGRAADVEGSVERWRAAAEIRPKLSGDEVETYRLAGEELRGRIWDPVASRMGAADLVLIVPDGALNLVSFETLPLSGGSYLMESMALLHYLSAERDLKRTASAPTPVNSLLAMGGPDFASKTAKPAASPEPGPVAWRSVLPSCGRVSDIRFDPLPASKVEAKEVAALWSNRSGNTSREPHVLTLTGAAATESAFKSAASRYRVLHVATHGFSMQEQCTSMRALADNPLLLTGLVFAGAGASMDLPPEQEDGFLTAEEVSSLDLSRVEWAVLSACQTGLGKVISGEGVLGLRRAFEVAGAHTLIMSLWKVEDEVTLRWMRSLYQARLEGLSTAAAGRKASLALLDAQRRKGRSTHPFYWGGFVAAGDWR
ncbi:MAG: tetratricopeptide repeat protein [Candidatus Polarisedimenticolia bacterium]